MKRRMLTVYYDDESGELARIDVSAAFHGESALMQADVLKDLIGCVELLYEPANAAAFAMLKPPISETPQ